MPPPMATPAALLERYVEAKDLVRPHLMSEIYAPDAVLTYSLATDSISFPARLVGVDSVTRTLVVDFAAKYTRCRTFYLCDSAPREVEQVGFVPWLVVMRESAAACLRIGSGYYQWTLDAAGGRGLRVAAMHIHVQRMDEIGDADGRLVRTVQSPLPYPWLPAAVLRSVFDALLEADPGYRFLNDFKAPLDRYALASSAQLAQRASAAYTR